MKRDSCGNWIQFGSSPTDFAGMERLLERSRAWKALVNGRLVPLSDYLEAARGAAKLPEGHRKVENWCYISLVRPRKRLQSRGNGYRFVPREKKAVMPGQRALTGNGWCC